MGDQRDLSRMPAAPLVYMIIVRMVPECNGRICNRPGFTLACRSIRPLKTAGHVTEAPRILRNARLA